ncbi:hypothetical protein GXW71_07015 [Roseomonas hellenica]|uniref:Chromosome partition protein Smc n=1 Tax=Plastoroseomonas hellenica TaxID=2687306 RepID=A0ABS5EV39_9PROT|nr:hypothetical protein [Plastoroseomonas hellenica]MBR0664103.1 hypothetical protein [Plastoroseomonas hellenica]
MVSGVAVLQETDARLAEAQREASAARAETDQLAARWEGLRQEEAAALRELARLHLAEIKDGTTAIDRLDAATAQVRDGLRQRAAGLEQAQQAVVAARAALTAAEARRDAEAEKRLAAEREQAAALRAAEAKAGEDEEYRHLTAIAADAERVAQHAEQKASFAQRDLEEKGRPYRDDPLFAYLWDRGFGTGRYRASPLVRCIDSWVARLARYEPARLSYALLSELPGHLEAHARQMREAADAAVRAMVDRRRALAGLPAPGDGPSATAMQALEDAVTAAHTALAEAEAKRGALAAGEDDASRAAMRQLEAAIGAQPLRALRELAARTPTQEDDAIVARLEVTATERARVERALQDARSQADSAQRRLADIQSLRHDMQGRGVEHSDWGFQTAALIGVLVSEVLRGGLSRDGFWDRMERQRTPGNDPWGRGGLPSPWNRPQPGPWGQAPDPWGSHSSGPWGADTGSVWGRPSKPPSSGGGVKDDNDWGGGGRSDPGGFRTGDSDSSGGFRTGGSV